MQLSPVFLENIKAVDGATGEIWLSGLEELIGELARQWELSSVIPVDNMTFNFVALARKESSGEHVVLKASPPDRPVWNEVRWLKHYQNVSPAVTEFDDLANAFLMSRCMDGKSLKNERTLMGDEAATRLLCGAIRGLRQVSAKDDSFRHLSDLIPDLDALENFTDKRSYAKAQDLFRDLTGDRSQDILLHVDLHHDNIIRGENGWSIIDPHGYQGHPAAETGPMIYNPLNELPEGKSLEALLEGRIRIMSEELGDDPQLLQAWCYCKTMLSAAWNVRDFPEQARHEIGLAQIIEKFRF